MARRPTHEELEQRAKELERKLLNHKRASKTFRDDEGFSSMLMNSSPNGILITNQDTSIRYLNPALEKMTGFSSEELIGKKGPYPWWTEQTTNKTCKDFEEGIHKTGRSLEQLFQTKNGQQLWVNITPYEINESAVAEKIPAKRAGQMDNKISQGEPMLQAVLVELTKRSSRNKRGQFTGTLYVIRDITERKRAEEALKEQTLRNELILQTAIDGFWIIDMEGKILHANHAASMISGYLQEEMVGMNIRDFEVLETPQEIGDHMQKIMTKGSDRFETRHRCKDGRILDLEVSTNFVEIGEESFFFSFFHDITKRKQAEEALIEKEKELETQSKNLEEINTALKVLLERKDEAKKELEEKVLCNMRELAMPYIERLKKRAPNGEQRAYLDILERNLNDIISPFSRRLSSTYMNLTPAEIQVADMIKQGKTTKEIAEFLNLSSDTIDFHRKNIRKKVGIRNKKTNLRSYLLAIQ